MIPLPILIPLLILIAFIVGWNIAVGQHRKNRRILEHTTRDLEKRVAHVNEQLAGDPQRAGIDMGKRYAVNQMQSTIDRIRNEVPKP
ncbi:MAG: hypothetical protein WB239_05250 [Acidimicrobiia bacterium]